MTDDFEQVELTEPKAALEGAGATVDIVAPKPGEVRGWNRTDWGDTFLVDAVLADTTASGYDGLLLPGGVINAAVLDLMATARRVAPEDPHYWVSGSRGA